jgi:penicillin amidase
MTRRETMATARPSTLPAPRPRRGRRILRAFLLLVGLLLVFLLVAGLWLRHRVTASLPQLRGELAIPGLSAPVAVERDALGVPTLRAATRLDAARALGFVHAQDRFFQMDLLRREASGEFSELFGPFMLLHDQNRRRHGCNLMASRLLAGMTPARRALLEAYAAGVNSGLKALGDKPFEYLLLRAEPRAWRPEDSILAIYAMAFDLEDWRTIVETGLGQVRDRVGAKVFDFVDPAGTEWDAPLVGPALPTPPIPGPDVLDLRKGPVRKTAALLPWQPAERREETPPGWTGWTSSEDLFAKTGSNAWAVAGSHTADGKALLANDMHLGISVPNIWYRASWSWREPDGTARRVTGVTLPGVPVLATGSTGRIAWGFTNSFADIVDLIDLELDPRDPEVYRTPAGPRRFTHSMERIRVKGQPDETLDVAKTIWGPVVDWDARKRPRRALAWTTDSPEATNLGLFDLESAKTIDDAIEIAHATGVPPQNFVVADSSGRVGWTIIGKLPRRVGWSGQVPGSWADGTRRWDGWLRSDEIPKVVDPPSGRIWSANNREVDGEAMARLGDGCYDLGARAKQIRDRLLGLERVTPRDMLALQLDDRALFLERWHDLLLRTLTPEAIKADPRRGELRRLLVTTWTGRATVDSVAYRVVREFRDTLEKQVFASLTGYPGSPDDLPFYRATRRFEGPLWRLVTERPAHLLDPRFASWDARLLAVADDVRNRLQALGPHLADRTWGEGNTLKIQHPLGAALPLLGRWLNIPNKAVPGDLDMPRVVGQFFSASERMVVSPGHEETGIFHMPVGESGHPLSPHYRDGHAAWVEGLPTPFLPGAPVDVLKLVPKP